MGGMIEDIRRPSMPSPGIYIALAAMLAGPALAQAAGTTDDDAAPATTDRTGTATAPASQDQTTTDRDQRQERKDRARDMKPLTAEQFVQKAAISGMFEVQSSELAADNAEDKEVNA